MFAKYKYQIYLCIIVLICYWPYTFFETTLLNDDIDVALATKYFAGSCYQHGELPLWNPFQIFGFPAYADLQYVNWNLEAIVIGILKGYDYNTLHVLFLVYLFIGALGIFKLSNYLSKKQSMAFYISCIYILSGIVTAHVQSLVTILGLVWLPYVLYYFFKWLNKPNLKLTIALSISTYLFFTMGYQAFAFMLLPILIALFSWQVIVNYKAKNYEIIKHYFLFGIVTIAFLVVLFAPVIVSQLQCKNFVSRLNGMSVSDVMANAFSPLGLISLINPILTIGHNEVYNTDVTMRNVFFGLIPLLLLVISFFKKNKTGLDYILLFFAVFYLLGSFGDVLPIRKLMYYTLPGFNLFRFPSLLRVVVFLSLISYLALNFKDTLHQFYSNRKLRHYSLVLLWITVLAIGLGSFYHIKSFQFFKLNELSFNDRVTKIDSYEIAFYVSSIQLVLLTAFWVLISKAIDVKHFFKLIIACTVLELAITISIYGQFVAFTNLKPQHFQSNFNKLTSNFPFPSKDAIKDNDVKYNHITGFWKNTGCFKKQLSASDEWTSFLFKNYNNLIDHKPELKDTLISYPFIYFSNPLKVEMPITAKIDTTVQFIVQSFHYQNASVSYEYFNYSPSNITVNCNALNTVVLNLQQTYYTGWEVKIDNVKQPLLWNAGLLMSVVVPKGNHTIEFKYENKLFNYSIILGYSVFVLLIILLIFSTQSSIQRKVIIIGIVLSISFILCVKFWRNGNNTNTKTQNNIVLQGTKTHTLKLSFANKTDIKKLIDTICYLKPQLIEYSWNNYYNSPELFLALGYKTNTQNTVVNQLNGTIMLNQNTNTILFEKNYGINFDNKALIDSTNTTFTLILNNKLNPYSPTITLNPTLINDKKIAGLVNLTALQNTNAVVVLSIKNTSGNETNLYFSLNKYIIPNTKNQIIPYYFDLTHLVKPDDTVKLFIMNVTDNTVYVKRITGFVCD